MVVNIWEREIARRVVNLLYWKTEFDVIFTNVLKTPFHELTPYTGPAEIRVKLPDILYASNE